MFLANDRGVALDAPEPSPSKPVRLCIDCFSPVENLEEERCLACEYDDGQGEDLRDCPMDVYDFIQDNR